MRCRSQGRYSFGVFAFDSRTGDLSRNGHRLRITEQARQVLTALLENPGDIVTREELRQELWPGGEFLDWGHSINKVVAQLRGTLRDNARDNRFIETVPKRGYRFIAPVQFEPHESTLAAAAVPMEPQVPDAAASQAESVGPRPEEDTKQEPPSVTSPELAALPQAQHSSTWTKRVAAFAGVIIVVGTLATLMALHFGGRQKPESDINIGIPPFEVYGEASNAMAESFRIDLTSALAELPRIRVRGAHSLTVPLRDDQSIRTTAQSMKLDLLLFGRLTLTGEQCVFNVEVVRGNDATHLASFRYTGSLQEVGVVREKIQRDLFDQLGLAERGTKWHTQSPTPDSKAYKDYLQARLDLSGWADAPVQEALAGFQRAIDADPNFANAYAGLASSYVLLAEHGAAPRDSSYRKAQEAATKALQLAPSTAEAHAILGQIALRQDWNFIVAERELRRAIELDPSRAMYHLWLSVLLCFQSRFDESLREIDLARAADPLWAPVFRTEAFLALRSGQTPRALRAVERHVALMPNWPPSYDQRAWVYWFSGRYLDAIADWRRMAQMEGDHARLQLEDEGLSAFQRGGLTAYARVRLKAIRSGYPYRHAAMDFAPAEWYCIAGEYDNALTEVEQMLARHDPDALQLAENPTFLPLHNRPRFVAVLTRIGLNPPRTQRASRISTSPSIRDSAVLSNPPLR